MTRNQLVGTIAGGLTFLVLVGNALGAGRVIINAMPWVTEPQMIAELDRRRVIRISEQTEMLKPITKALEEIQTTQRVQGNQIREIYSDRANDRISNLEFQINQLQVTAINVEDAVNKDPANASIRLLLNQTKEKIADLRARLAVAQCEEQNLSRVTPRQCND